MRPGDDDLNQSGGVDTDVKQVVGEQLREIMNLLGVRSERGAFGLGQREENEQRERLVAELVSSVENDREKDLADVVRGNEGAILVRVASELSESSERGESKVSWSGIGGCLVEKGANQGRVCGLFGRGDTLHTESAVSDAPVLDKAAEGVVGDKGEVGESGTCDGARGVAGANPGLDAGSVVGLTGADGDRISHEFKGDWASEVVGYVNPQIQGF